MEEKLNSKNQLKGRENFLPWLTRLETILSIDGVLMRNAETDTLQILGEGTTLAKNEKTAKRYVVTNCDDRVMHSITPTESFNTIIDKLNGSYGFGNVDPSIILNQLRELKFHPSKDPSIILNDIDMRLAELESAGGGISASQLVQYIHDGLSGDPLRDSFWFNCKGEMSMKKLSSYSVESAGQFIVRYWHSYKPKKFSETANTGQERKKYEKRFCQKCSDADRNRIMKTHNTVDCRVETAKVALKNKEVANYTSPDIYHDSGASKTMINYVPQKKTKKASIQIMTAGKNQAPEFGINTGTINIGSLDVEAIQVPSFSKNLLSATQLSLDHGCKQVIEPWTSKLTITKDDKVVATGSYEPSTKLIKLDKPAEYHANTAALDTWTTVHRKMGHVGNAMMQKTLKSVTGISLSNKFTPLDCEDCSKGKAKRSAIPKESKRTVPHEMLDVLQIDIQGPFPVIANDGSCYNLKMIDTKSSWLYFTTIPNTKSETVLDHFLQFKARIERQTGRKIKRVRTDQGNEFLKEFLSNLVLSGIIDEKGVAYTHHHPGKVERAHQTVLRLGRAMLTESKLPTKFYDEAFSTAAYIFNRTVHGCDTITPYEHVFQRKPNLSNLKPFGSVCYAYLPHEKRSKLEDSGIKCRFLGYGDDFKTQEINGFKLLKEDDGTIIYSDSVQFKRHFEMERLDPIFYADDDSERLIVDDLWREIDPDHSDVPIDNSSESDSEEFFDAEDSDEAEYSEEKESAQAIEEFYAFKAIVEGTPVTFKEAMSSKDSLAWKQAMDVELKNNKIKQYLRYQENETWRKSNWVPVGI
jgi:hypothetical protein